MTEGILQKLVGAPLSAVTFVMDYLQLQLDGAGCLNIYAPLAVSFGEQVYWFGDEAFRNALCSLIGKHVVQVDFQPDVILRLAFDEDMSLTISLNPLDFEIPEAFEFSGHAGPWVVYP